MSPAVALLAVVLLIAANGAFVAFEFGLVASRRVQLEQRAQDGSRGAAAALDQLTDLSFVLSAAQFGITATSLVVGFLAEDAIGGVVVDPVLELLRLPEGARAGVAVAVAFALSSVVQMLLGELAPKNLALALPETTASRLAALMRLYGIVFGPLIRLFDGAAAWTTRRLFGVEVAEERLEGHAPEELARIIAASHEEGQLSPLQGELLERAVALGDRRVHEVMVPRPQVELLDADEVLADLRAAARRTGHSRFPVCDDLGDVIGTVHVKDLLGTPVERHHEAVLRDVAEPPLAVPESHRLRRLLGELRGSQRTFALVVDEFGDVTGIATVEDVLEELVGEIEDEFDTGHGQVRRMGPDRALLDGSLRLDEAEGALAGLELPDGDYETVAGFVIDRLGRIPAAGAAVTHEGWELVARRMDGLRLAEVLVRRLPEDLPVRSPEPEDGS